MNGRLLKICSVHTYVWSKVDSCFCESVYLECHRNDLWMPSPILSKMISSANIFSNIIMRKKNPISHLLIPHLSWTKLRNHYKNIKIKSILNMSQIGHHYFESPIWKGFRKIVYSRALHLIWANKWLAWTCYDRGKPILPLFSYEKKFWNFLNCGFFC